jgi:hypothetical protein
MSGLLRSTFAFAAVLPLAASSVPAKPTFSKDVLPVFQKACQECHRPGEAAPFSMLSYKDVRPWAKSIKQAVVSKKMPPWFADPNYGKFANDRSLSQTEIDTIVKWVDSGAPEGNPKDAPPNKTWTTGWAIPTPDVTYKMRQPFEIPATGVVDYQHIVIPSGFTEDKWIQFAEARPGNRALTHHIVVYVREPGSKWLADAEPYVPYQPKKLDPNLTSSQRTAALGSPGEILVGYAPGTPPIALKPGTAKKVKAGSDFVFQLHYTPTGKAGSDISELGLVFAKEPVKERVMVMAATNMGFAIPPGADNYEVKSSITLNAPAKLIDFNPHMHVRGKDFQYKIVYPDGREEIALKVKYDFNWQLYYTPVKPYDLPAGTRIECVAHFDNSANNPYNPDPKATVRWGLQTFEEMMNGFFDIAFDANMDPAEFRRPLKRPSPTGGTN